MMYLCDRNSEEGRRRLAHGLLTDAEHLDDSETDFLLCTLDVRRTKMVDLRVIFSKKREFGGTVLNLCTLLSPLIHLQQLIRPQIIQWAQRPKLVIDFLDAFGLLWKTRFSGGRGRVLF